MYQNIPTKVLTGEARLSYANLNEPKPPQNGQGEPKYSVTLLIPKTDTATLNDIVHAIAAAEQAAIPKTWGGSRPPMLGTPVYQGYDYPKHGIPLYDGDSVTHKGKSFGDEAKGCWVLSASSKTKPQIVHKSNIAVGLLPTDVYSGMYARVTINFSGYNNINQGIGCYLGNVMKTRDGEPLAGGASAQTDFEGVAEQLTAGFNPLAG